MYPRLTHFVEMFCFLFVELFKRFMPARKNTALKKIFVFKMKISLLLGCFCFTYFVAANSKNPIPLEIRRNVNKDQLTK